MVSVGVEEELVEDILHVACVMHKWWHSLVSRFCFLLATPAKILTSHTQQTPSADRPMRATESDPPWGWLGLACETTARTAPETKGLSLLHTYMHTRV